MKNKIYIHTMYYLPEYGSAPILMHELAVFLSRRGYQVEVISTIPRPPHHRNYRWKIVDVKKEDGFIVRRYRTNFTVHHIGRLIAWSLYTLWSIWNLRRVRNGDTVLLRLPPLQLGIVGFVAKKLLKIKIVLSVQDIHPDLSIQSGLLKNVYAIKAAMAFEKWIYTQSDSIIVISEGFKQNLAAKGVCESKLSIIANWVDTDFLCPYPKDNDISRKFDLYDRFVLMYSGTITLSSYKTLKKIMKAVNYLKDERRLLLVIIGEGLKKPDLEAEAKRLNLNNILFLSFQPYKDLPYLLASSDILLVPLDKEKTQLSVPSKLYNYMSVGKPILTTSDSGSEVARIIREANCGFYTDPEDEDKISNTIKKLLDSPHQLEFMGNNSRKYVVKKYSRDIILSLYEKILTE